MLSGTIAMSLPRASFLTILLIAGCQAAQAQSLPAPSRTVYKCDANGKTHYSDAPCLGATRIEVEPTRGLDKSTGTERIGRDVAQEVRREQFATALKPITGLGAKGLEVAGRRQKLDAGAQRRCDALDMALPDHERQAVQAPSSARHGMDSELLNLRAEYRRLGC
jgi:hypothetical protein